MNITNLKLPTISKRVLPIAAATALSMGALTSCNNEDRIDTFAHQSLNRELSEIDNATAKIDNMYKTDKLTFNEYYTRKNIVLNDKLAENKKHAVPIPIAEYLSSILVFGSFTALFGRILGYAATEPCGGETDYSDKPMIGSIIGFAAGALLSGALVGKEHNDQIIEMGAHKQNESKIEAYIKAKKEALEELKENQKTEIKIETPIYDK